MTRTTVPMYHQRSTTGLKLPSPAWATMSRLFLRYSLAVCQCASVCDQVTDASTVNGHYDLAVASIDLLPAEWGSADLWSNQITVPILVCSLPLRSHELSFFQIMNGDVIVSTQHSGWGWTTATQSSQIDEYPTSPLQTKASNGAACAIMNALVYNIGFSSCNCFSGTLTARLQSPPGYINGIDASSGAFSGGSLLLGVNSGAAWLAFFPAGSPYCSGS